MLSRIAASAFLFALYARIEPPWHMLGWIVLVPWLGALDRTRSLRGAALAGAAMATAFVLVVFGWFASAIRAYTGASAACNTDSAARPNNAAKHAIAFMWLTS